ncbi:MAG: endonuclease III [Nanoarchaeota archaeon]
MISQTKALKQLKELEKLSKEGIRLAAEEWSKPWQTLISTMLSARTRDETTIRVSSDLFKKYKTARALGNATINQIQNIIRPVNFFRNKSKNVKNCAKILAEQFKGNPSHDFNELVKLPGVGRKTANVFLSEYGKDEIGIDTHVNHISHYLGWTKGKNQEQVETDLKKLFPKQYWGRLNRILVRFGKTHMSKKKKNELLDKIRRIK